MNLLWVIDVDIRESFPTKQACILSFKGEGGLNLYTSKLIIYLKNGVRVYTIMTIVYI